MYTFQSVSFSYPSSCYTVLVLSTEIPILLQFLSLLFSLLFCFLRQGCVWPKTASDCLSHVLGAHREHYYMQNIFLFPYCFVSQPMLSWNSLNNPDWPQPHNFPSLSPNRANRHTEVIGKHRRPSLLPSTNSPSLPSETRSLRAQAALNLNSLSN